MTTNQRLLSTLIAQFPITLNIWANLKSMNSIISRASENEIVLFPEGALSGYDPDPYFLKNIQTDILDKALQRLQNQVNRHKIHLIFGSCLHQHDQWANCGLYFSYNSRPFIYQKVNLATNERGHFKAGEHLPVFEMNMGNFSIRAGMQLCREIRFPEQWQHLARSGAEILVYLTNAVGDNATTSVWRSHLISRAAENQRFVLAANNADERQKCPTMLIDPLGNVVSEMTGSDIGILREEIDVSKISNWYLNQARTDIVEIAGNASSSQSS